MERQPLTRRLPKNYALVRDIVLAAGRGAHQSANDIYRKAREAQPSIGFATVHRGLGRLCELGEVMKIQLSGGDSAWYEPPARAHAHLHCDRCGQIVDVDYATAPRTLRSIAEREGVRIEAESLTFRGLCRTCARRRRKTP